MFKASVVEGTLMLYDPKFRSWEEIEVKIRETLMQALDLHSMDSVSIDFDRYAGLEEFDGEVADAR